MGTLGLSPPTPSPFSPMPVMGLRAESLSDESDKSFDDSLVYEFESRLWSEAKQENGKWRSRLHVLYSYSTYYSYCHDERLMVKAKWNIQEII